MEHLQTGDRQKGTIPWNRKYDEKNLKDLYQNNDRMGETFKVVSLSVIGMKSITKHRSGLGNW